VEQPNIQNTLTIRWAGSECILDSNKALYFTAFRKLIISDLHLGKTQHFRRAGVGVPNGVTDQNFIRLDTLLKTYNPEEVVFLGDLFHSHINTTWDRFNRTIECYPNIKFTLVVGNHDILSDDVYERSGLDELKEIYMIENICLSHHPIDVISDGYYNMAGHVHPGVRLTGKGRHSVRLPCFYFGKQASIMPAFGGFTGMHIIKPVVGDQIIAIVGNGLININSGDQ
jgi:DNA ligase-associated metallophosphoesterase